MKDFKSFSQGDGFEEDKGVELIKRVAERMQGKSGSEIMRAVIAEAEKGKREGTLTNEDLDNFYNMTAPTLNGFRRKALKNIVEQLKRI